MVDVTEILVHWHAGRSHSEIATSLGVDRKTLKKYLAPAVEAGIVPGGPAKPVAEWEALVCNWFPEIVDMRVRQTTWPEIDKHREYIVAMLAAGVSKATIWQRLRDELGLTASVASLKRYVAANLPEEGQRARVTVLRADPPPGEEAQIDYGYLGVVDRPGRWPHPADLGVRDGAGVLPVDVRAAGAADGPARLDRGARGGVRVLRRLCGCRYLDSSRNGVRMGVARDGERRCCGPCLVRSSGPGGEVRASLGDPLVDDYLRCRGAVAPEHGSGDGLRPEGVLLGASLGHVVPDDLRTSVSWRGSIRRREWPALEKESTP